MYPEVQCLCKDEDEQIYPVSFGIGNVENKKSWSWFLNQLGRAIGCPENAIFISDQHLGIKNAIEKVYKDAHHDLCNYHLGKNIKNMFKLEDVGTIYTLAANCYRLTDFNRHMNKLKQLYKPAYDRLMRLGSKRWARVRSPIRRYRLMTSNIAECINSCLKHVRKMPITVRIECIKAMFQHWFLDRHNEALNLTMPLSPWVIDLLNKQFNEACHFSIQPIDRMEFQVIGGTKDAVVNLCTKTCSCGEFQTDLLPYTHAMAAISKYKCAAIEFCSDYYFTRSWVDGYAVPIHSIGHPSEWDIPYDVKQMVVLPPTWGDQEGKPRRKRIPSAGESSRRHRYSQCKSYGHNRQNCLMLFPTLSTNGETSSTQSTAQ
ncbi:uncharacterized protein LOC110412271 [Herrania umbratica]|uniref:Uncharacterized protein LOC110412271 n=1 Tax=Herrania umbratica TaxID=108875 RepID=A0A6J0ZV76_9ROSI|nr:uncharacterized protein LOC110412271 [Herrania umbratica]